MDKCCICQRPTDNEVNIVTDMGGDRYAPWDGNCLAPTCDSATYIRVRLCHDCINNIACYSMSISAKELGNEEAD